MSKSTTKHLRHRLLLAGALLCCACTSQAAVGDCVKSAGLSAESALPGPVSTALPTDKTLDDKPKKSTSSGSAGVLRMLIPSALRHNPSS